MASSQPSRASSNAFNETTLPMMVMAGAIALSGRVYDDTFRWVGVLIFVQVLIGFRLLLSAQRRGGFKVGKAGMMH